MNVCLLHGCNIKGNLKPVCSVICYEHKVIVIYTNAISNELFIIKNNDLASLYKTLVSTHVADRSCSIL